MPFRFVHTADIHLDSPLRSLALRNEELAELIGNATRQAFVNTIDLCLDESVDALLLAGDLYDDKQTSMKTARFLADQLKRLDAAGIQTFIIRGNHDALSKITRELVFPSSVKVFGGRAEAVAIERPRQQAPVVVHGLSFSKPQAPENLVPKFKPTVEGAINIGLLHTSLGGAPGHDTYAPCKISDLVDTGYQYWALGHIHKRSVVVEEGCTIVMPGIQQGRHINESGPRSVSLVTIQDDGACDVDARTTGVAQFERVTVDLSEVTEWAAVPRAFSDALKTARLSAKTEHLVVRLHLKGETPLAWRIRRDSDLALEEAQAAASSIGYCWVEKLVVECQPPKTVSSSESNPVTELHELMKLKVMASHTFQQQSMAIVDELTQQLPPECRGFLGDDDEELKAGVEALVEDGIEQVVAQLYSKSEAGE